MTVGIEGLKNVWDCNVFLNTKADEGIKNVKRMYTFKKIKPTDLDWDLISNSNESTIFSSKEWFKFMSKRPNWHPSVISCKYKENLIGYIIGEQLNFGFVKFMGFPIEGTGTYNQGLICTNNTIQINVDERVNIYKEFLQWLSSQSIKLLQISDYQLRNIEDEYIEEKKYRFPSLDAANISYSTHPTYVIDLDKSEDELWAALNYKSCKYCINKAIKEGLKVRVIEHEEEILPFIKEHMLEKNDVSRRHGRKYSWLTYGEWRIKHLCKTLFPNKILMLQVIGKNKMGGGEYVCASGIFGVDEGMSIYYSGCSYAKYQKLCPNELMVWEAMRILHNKGSKCLNMIGINPYKRKFGAHLTYVPRITSAKANIATQMIMEIKCVYKKLKNLQTKIRTSVFHYGSK